MSDQDFFFDEDEQPKAESTSAPVKKVSAPKAASKAAPAAPAAQGVSVAVASLIGVIALLAGLIVGILLPIGGGTTAAPATTASPAGQTAPQLSEEQMSGGLPQGHPDIGAMGGSTGTSGTTDTGE